MSARCVRPDCDLPAAARLSAAFGDGVGWLCDIDGSEVSPHDYLLCARHADSLTLPRSWELHDQRSRRIASFPTPARSSTPEPISAPEPVDEPATPVQQDQAEAGSEPDRRPLSVTPDPGDDRSDAPPTRSAEAPAAAYDPAEEVDDSTPLLSRAFRAAMPGSTDAG